MNLKEYKINIAHKINSKYPRQEINPASLGKHKISFEEALEKIKDLHPGQTIWNCRICNNRYVFQVSTGPMAEFTYTVQEYYIDYNTREYGFHGFPAFYYDWNWYNRKKWIQDTIDVWIDLSPEEAYHSDKETLRLRDHLLSATLLEKQK